MRSPFFTLLLVAACCLCIIAPSYAAKDLRNNATEFTVAANQNANSTPAWSNSEDFDFASRGLIATYDPLIIPADIPNIIAWNAEAFRRFENGSRSDTINPLLYRQAQLNNIHGLIMVKPGIYQQVRGFDASSMTLVKGDTGWIIIDPLSSVETARAAMALVNKSLGPLPVKAVIYSHPHADHYQGVIGVTTSDAVTTGRVAIIAPEHFMEYAISENVYAGNAMQRRAVCQFGLLLPRDEKGLVDIGIGKTISTGTASLIPPTIEITHTGQEVTIDGVRMEFQMAEET